MIFLNPHVTKVRSNPGVQPPKTPDWEKKRGVKPGFSVWTFFWTFFGGPSLYKLVSPYDIPCIWVPYRARKLWRSQCHLYFVYPTCIRPSPWLVWVWWRKKTLVYLWWSQSQFIPWGVTYTPKSIRLGGLRSFIRPTTDHASKIRIESVTFILLVAQKHLEKNVQTL